MKTKISNWSNYPIAECDEKSFSMLKDLSLKVRTSSKAIARGNGRCYGDASISDVVFSTLQYDKILEFDTAKGIFNCEAGISLDTILEYIVPEGWFLPVTPGTKFITIGGALASDVHGKNHHLEGCFSKHVIDIDIMDGNGAIVTCSPENNADLFNATAGGMGLTGIITRVKFNLKKIETAYIKQKMIRAENLDEIIQLFEKYKSYTYSVAWIDCLKGGKGFGRSILMLGEHARIEDLESKQQESPLIIPEVRKLNFPFYMPSFTLNRFTMLAFNFLFYNRMMKKEINNIIPYEPFFYPLDAVLNWNRGYGRKGFVQYQFVIPEERKDGLVKILNRIQKDGHASCLAVLKIFGKEESLISFPMQGYTLALDFPVSKKLFAFLDELDKMVLELGGRIYLSKDARMKPVMFDEGYPNAAKFKEIVKKFNRDEKFASMLSDRLKIFH